MTALPLPALEGRSPLGFLAALGILRLITDNGNPRARLSWSVGDCTAALHGAHDSLDALVEELHQIVQSIPEGGVLPHVPIDFPPLGEAPDKLRLQPPQLRDYATGLHDDLAGPDAERWLSSLVTDLSVDDRGRANISLFAAPSGKQSMRTMLTKPLTMVRANPGTLGEAVSGWRRYSGVTGEYLDHRVLFDAADAPDGKPAERGVPAATWLALMAYPLFLTTRVSGHPVTSGWQHARGRPSTRRFVYPLWSAPLDVNAAITLLEHPVFADADPGTPPSNARALSVFLICSAERQKLTGRTFAGVLTPIRPDRAAVPAAKARKTTSLDRGRPNRSRPSGPTIL